MIPSPCRLSTNFSPIAKKRQLSKQRPTFNLQSLDHFVNQPRSHFFFPRKTPRVPLRIELIMWHVQKQHQIRILLLQPHHQIMTSQPGDLRCIRAPLTTTTNRHPGRRPVYRRRDPSSILFPLRPGRRERNHTLISAHVVFRRKPRHGDGLRRDNRLDGIAFVAEVVEVVVDGGFVEGFVCSGGAAARGVGLLELLV